MRDSQPKTERPKADPKALTTEYHRARKQLVLWAGILLIWALVGVNLTLAGAAGGNVGAIINAIESKQAVPWVLVILVGYFEFKTTIEWFQCTLNRRKLLVSRIDFISAWVISLVAFSLYFGQKISNVRLVDVFTFSGALSLIWGAVAAFAIGGFTLRVIRMRVDGARIGWLQLASTAVAMLIYTVPIIVGSYLFSRFLFGTEIRWFFILAGALFMLIFLAGINFSWVRRGEPLTQTGT